MSERHKNFLERSFKRFPKVDIAIKQLQKSRRPPSSAAFNNSYPSESIVTVIDVLGALVASFRPIDPPPHRRKPDPAATQNLRDHWTQLFSPWIRFFLEEVALAREEASTPEGRDAWEHVVFVIPELLISLNGYGSFSNGGGLTQPELATIVKASSYLRPLVMQVWLLVLDRQHDTWGAWSSLVPEFAIVCNGTRPSPGFLRRGPYGENDKLGGILVRHLNYLADRIPDMPARELDDITRFVLCLTGPHYSKKCPLEWDSVCLETIPAVCRLLSAVSYKRRKVKEAALPLVDDDLQECRVAHYLASMTLAYVITLMGEKQWVLAALDAGILKALLKFHRHLFVYEASVNSFLYLEKIGTMTNPPFEFISRFLVYPEVLHAFWKAVNRIRDLDKAEEQMRQKSPVIIASWEKTKQKAKYLRSFRHSIKKQDPGIMCRNRLCPLRFGKETTPPKRWLRCTCLVNLYCSHGCRKMDWELDHRGSCAIFKEANVVNQSTTQYDYVFFHQWTGHHIALHAKAVKKAINDYVNSLSKLNRDRLTADTARIVTRVKPPIVVLDFDQPGMFMPSTLRVTDIKGLKSFKPIAGWLDDDHEWVIELRQMWEGPSVKGTTVLVVGMYPHLLSGSMPCKTFLDWSQIWSKDWK